MGSERLLLSYLRSKWYVYLLALIAIAGGNVIHSQYPRLLGSFTDELQQGALTKLTITGYSLKLLGVGVSYGLLVAAGQYLIMRAGRWFEYTARQRLFGQFTRLNSDFHTKHGVGRLLSYVMNDVTAVRESISMGINHAINSTILILSAVVTMAFSSIPLPLIGVCILPLMLIPYFVIRFRRPVRERSLRVQETLGAMTESAEEQFGGIRVARKFAVEEVMAQRFADTVDRIRESQLSLVRVSAFFQSLIPLLGSLSLVVTLAYGGYLTLQGRITLGQFVALTLYMRMMVNPLQQIGRVINTMQRSRASLQRIGELLQREPDIRDSADAADADLEGQPISVRNLSFTYPDSGEEVLRDVSVEIPPGRQIGILGRTGSGKSTLVKLLLRIYDPPEGAIHIGGTDLRELSLQSLRSQIAYVPQEGFLFSTTIRDNIAFYRRESPIVEVEEAAGQAQIRSSIEAFADGYDTLFGERGITLSCGQRQRTSLARGLIKNAPVLILDDSVSAVDTVTEQRIIETVRTERKGRTTILIAHRISAVRHADEILVMDGGRIIERGTHAQLLWLGGWYARMHAIQEEGSPHVPHHFAEASEGV
ncbi:ABC transporter ATP-binding protein [Paenibacillus sp. S-38]|uniref:ABC transporter ATP-binding protein n=1 Tax=Paenibacillus sp. S-38 TaxID=3416710 RepID=UPI003CF356BF